VYKTAIYKSPISSLEIFFLVLIVKQLIHFCFTDVKKPKKNTRGIYSSILAQKVAVEKNARANYAPPRNAGTIFVDLTPRQFSAPLRESKTEEEEKWTKKRYEILKKSILVTIH
jgi:hypothetical protein